MTRPIAAVYPGSIALFAVGIGIAAAAPSIWVAAGAMVLTGIGNGAAVVANITLVQRGAPDHLRGRAFTVIMSVNFAIQGAAMVVAGPATDRFGARWVWGGSALLLVVAAAVAHVMARRLLVLERPAEEQVARQTAGAPAN